MHRNVRALSRGLALIGELNASGPSNVVQLAKRTGLNRTTCYRLLDTLREDGYVTFDEMNALFGLTPQVRTLSEGVSSRDLSTRRRFQRCSVCSTRSHGRAILGSSNSVRC